MGAGCWYSGVSPQETSLSLLAMGEKQTEAIDADRFAIPELNQRAEQRLPAEEGFSCKKFRAGIVNHHALASDLLAGFFRVLRRCRPEVRTMVILSPDHNLVASSPAVTHRRSYRVGVREIASDTEMIDRLLSEISFAREQPTLFDFEHGIGALLPFLVNEFPEANLVPIVLRHSLTTAERARLASWMATEVQDSSVFFIVSSDMSHYLSDSVAWTKQDEVKRALIEKDPTFFVRAKDEHTDTGKSIAVVMEAFDTSKWTPLGESISSAYAGSPLYTTTYLIGFWE